MGNLPWPFPFSLISLQSSRNFVRTLSIYTVGFGRPLLNSRPTSPPTLQVRRLSPGLAPDGRTLNGRAVSRPGPLELQPWAYPTTTQYTVQLGLLLTCSWAIKALPRALGRMIGARLIFWKLPPGEQCRDPLTASWHL